MKNFKVKHLHHLMFKRDLISCLVLILSITRMAKYGKVPRSLPPTMVLTQACIQTIHRFYSLKQSWRSRRLHRRRWKGHQQRTKMLLASSNPSSRHQPKGASARNRALMPAAISRAKSKQALIILHQQKKRRLMELERIAKTHFPHNNRTNSD